MNSVQLAAIDLNLLVLFEAVFAERHVGRAAQRLRVTPSAVSHGLRRLRQLFDDVLFLRVPKGVVPTARATELATPILDILARVESVVSSVEPFDPARSTRRFSIGAADATAAVLLPRLSRTLRQAAPQIDLGIRHLLPQSGLGELDAGAIDIVVLALDAVPARFFAKVISEEEFVIAARAGHPFLKKPDLHRYCQQRHLLVTMSGEHQGHIDQVLAKKGLSRRVALTVPSFMLALTALAASDLVAAVPGSLVEAHAARFGLGSVKAPLALRRWQLRAITPAVKLADPGVAWLFDAVEHAASSSGYRRGRAHR
jgi:DNA-binding transcriptional LysR family regulator